MKTLCITEGKETSFVFADVESAYLEAVRGLYYRPVANGFAKTYPADTPNLDRIYRNFAHDAQEMVLQTARIHPVKWDIALSAFLEIIEGSNIDWWLTGSAALAVRGLDIVPGDLDLVVDDASASSLGELLLDYLVEPIQPSPGWIWNWFGRAFLHARLEWVGGVNKSADSPDVVDFGPTAGKRLEIVEWHGKKIRVPLLDFQLDVSKRRGLTERAEKISRFLNNQRQSVSIPDLKTAKNVPKI